MNACENITQNGLSQSCQNVKETKAVESLLHLQTRSNNRAKGKEWRDQARLDKLCY